MLESSNKFNHDYHLKKAIDTETPVTSGGTPSPEMSEKSPDKKKMSMKNKLLIGGAGIALAAVAATGIGLGVSASGEKAPEATSSSAPVNTGEQGNDTKPETPALTVESISLDPDATPESLATTFVERLGEWRMAGANEATYNRSLSFTGSDTEFLQQESKKNAAIFAEALFGSDWDKSADATSIVNFYEKQNYYALRDYLATFTEKTPFEWKETVEGTPVVAKSSETGSTVEIVFVSTNNSADNRTREIEPDMIAANGSKNTTEIVFAKADGHVYVLQMTGSADK